MGRLGSDEFAIALPETTGAEARLIGEALRDVVSEPVTIDAGSQSGFVFRVTMSAGVACLGGDGSRLGDLTAAAGSPLSEARRRGWTCRVCLAPGGPPPRPPD